MPPSERHTTRHSRLAQKPHSAVSEKRSLGELKHARELNFQILLASRLRCVCFHSYSVSATQRFAWENVRTCSELLARGKAHSCINFSAHSASACDARAYAFIVVIKKRLRGVVEWFSATKFPVQLATVLHYIAERKTQNYFFSLSCCGAFPAFCSSRRSRLWSVSILSSGPRSGSRPRLWWNVHAWCAPRTDLYFMASIQFDIFLLLLISIAPLTADPSNLSDFAPPWTVLGSRRTVNESEFDARSSRAQTSKQSVIGNRKVHFSLRPKPLPKIDPYFTVIDWRLLKIFLLWINSSRFSPLSARVVVNLCFS